MPPKKVPAPEKQAPKLKVFGNFFCPEMRTVCALLELNDIEFDLEEMDIFTQKGQAEYLGFNPSEQMPTLIEGMQTILADPPHIYKYICKTKSIDEKFYPTKDMNRDKKKIIDQYLEYIQCLVKKNQQRLLKLMIEKELIERGVLVQGERFTYEESDRQKEEDCFFNIICQNLENALEGGKLYLCGYDFSIADIAIFNEIISTLETINKNVDNKKFPNLDKWMKRIEDIGPIQKATLKFQEEHKRMVSMFRQ